MGRIVVKEKFGSKIIFALEPVWWNMIQSEKVEKLYCVMNNVLPNALENVEVYTEIDSLLVIQKLYNIQDYNK